MKFWMNWILNEIRRRKQIQKVKWATCTSGPRVVWHADVRKRGSLWGLCLQPCDLFPLFFPYFFLPSHRWNESLFLSISFRIRRVTRVTCAKITEWTVTSPRAGKRERKRERGKVEWKVCNAYRSPRAPDRDHDRERRDVKGTPRLSRAKGERIR